MQQYGKFMPEIGIWFIRLFALLLVPKWHWRNHVCCTIFCSVFSSFLSLCWPHYLSISLFLIQWYELKFSRTDPITIVEHSPNCNSNWNALSINKVCRRCFVRFKQNSGLFSKQFAFNKKKNHGMIFLGFV